MNLYTKYILPKYLNLAMGSKDFDTYRKDTASKANGIVLEIGFGSGLNLPYFTNVSKLYALDPSDELYTLAQERIYKVSFTIEQLQASAENIPLDTNSIDSVISTWTLCSIPYPEIALKEIFRVLKPSGKFLFIEHGKSPRSFITKIQNFLTPISKRVAGGCHMNRDIEKLILDAGFEIQQIEKFAQKSKPLAFMYQGVAVARK
ncbi:MAG: class I SAM-dependent methyltransferase [Patescibacteria group bacterium]